MLAKTFVIITVLSLLSSLISSSSDASDAQSQKFKKAKTDLIKNLYKVKNINELTKFGVKVVRGPQALQRTGERPNPDVKEATPGKCDPKPVCITNPLVENLTPNEAAFPQCINIHRCDGCCPPNEKCVAIKSHNVKLSNVGIVKIENENEMRLSSQNIITVLNHTDCECQCQWQTDEDCRVKNNNYIKNPYACECICPEEISCGILHDFDHETCSCKCKKEKFGRLEQTCKTRGYSWNDNLCKCDTLRINLTVKEVKIV